ncbi:MAG: hypothetical protein ACOCWD_07720 [Tangfeifania sp.]
MKKTLFTIILLCAAMIGMQAQNTEPDFRWGNGYYFNLNVGDSIRFNNQTVRLIQIENHFNQLAIGADTIRMKVSRRTPAKTSDGIRLFVADNKNVKALTTDKKVHGLLKKDALVCLSNFRKPLLDFRQYIFPVSYNDGFLWSTGEDTYMFSYLGEEEKNGETFYRSYEGMSFDLHDARGTEKHWLLAIENSTVEWVLKDLGKDGQQACVLLQSNSQPGIFYLYNHLFKKNVVVKEGQELVRGEPIGTIWGDSEWGHLQFVVIHSENVPGFSERFNNVVNGFPQIYELYFQEGSNYRKTFSKGRIYFGRPRWINGNQKNIACWEPYSGKGWQFGRWNTTGKTDWVNKGEKGNARLKKVLFEGTPAEVRNPDNFYEYEINVRNGTYRIRAELGDQFLPSWQKVSFEEVEAGEFLLEVGESTWTSERAVNVKDGNLTVRIYIDEKNQKIAGLSQIVFQRAY